MKHYLFVMVCAMIMSCGTNRTQIEEQPFEKHQTLEGTGFTQGRLDSLTSHIENNMTTTGLLILKDGKVIYEYGDLDQLTYIASCRKSVLSMLYGKYVEDGTIDLNETVASLGIDEEGGLLDIEKSATVENIITARSGVFYEPANGGYDEANVLERGTVKPGDYFLYNNWDFNVAGHILEQKAGKDIYEEIEDQLAIPLGFQDWNIKKQRKKYGKGKSQYPAYHMYFSTRDMAKIGQLMLNEGEWKGEQLISKKWIQQMTTAVTPVEEVNSRYNLNQDSPYQQSYGYMWWMLESIKEHPDFEGAYSATGFGGQFITVIPKLNIVVAHKTKLGIPNYLGWRSDVPHWQYWELLHKFIAT